MKLSRTPELDPEKSVKRAKPVPCHWHEINHHQKKDDVNPGK